MMRIGQRDVGCNRQRRWGAWVLLGPMTVLYVIMLLKGLFLGATGFIDAWKLNTPDDVAGWILIMLPGVILAALWRLAFRKKKSEPSLWVKAVVSLFRFAYVGLAIVMLIFWLIPGEMPYVFRLLESVLPLWMLALIFLPDEIPLSRLTYARRIAWWGSGLVAVMVSLVSQMNSSSMLKTLGVLFVVYLILAPLTLMAIERVEQRIRER